MNATIREAKRLAAELLHGTSRSEFDQTAVRRRLWLLDMIADMEQTNAVCVRAGQPVDPRIMAR